MLRALVRLGPRRWVDVVQQVAVAAAVEVGLRTVRLPRLAPALGLTLVLDGRAAPPGDLDAVPLNRRELERLDSAWRILRRRPFNPTCLRRALIGGWVMRRHQPRLRIGVIKTAGRVSAHAWVEVGGVSLDPDAADTYRVLATTIAEDQTPP